MLHAIWQDVRQAWRGWRRAPGLSAVVLTTLGLALGACVATFSVVNATLLRPLPFADVDRVMFVEHRYGAMRGAVSPPTFLDYRRQTRSFASLAVVAPLNANLTGRGEPERVRGLMVSPAFFDTLGVPAALGRTFRADEEQPGREKVVVIGDGLWRRRLGASPAAIGETVRLNGEPFEIVGVMPAGFAFGRTYGREAASELWTPFALSPVRVSESSRGSEFLDLYGRLAPGVTREQAMAELEGVIAGLRVRFPRRFTPASGFQINLLPIQDDIVSDLRRGLLIVLAAVAALVLVAATNTAGLLLARAVGRTHETSVRVALGASRGALVRWLFAEAGIVAVAAGSIGVLAAGMACAVLDRIDPVVLPRAQPIRIDATVAMVAIGATLAVALVAGLWPAWHVARGHTFEWLKTRGVSGGHRAAVARRGLIVVQAAVALVLLVGTGLLVRSLSALQEVRTGFRTDGVVAAAVELPKSRFDTAADLIAVVDRIAALADGRPEIQAFGAISQLPLGSSSNSGSFGIDGRLVPAEEKEPHAEIWSATPGYFDAMGVTLVAGRLFDARDRGAQARVAIVSESLAAQYFAGESPLGHRIDFEGSPGQPRWRIIIGVVADVRDRGLDRPAGPQLYVPYAQATQRGVSLVARTPALAPAALQAALRAVVAEADPELPLYGMTTMERLVEASVRDRQVMQRTLGAFAVAALLLAALGIYALLAQTVRERVPEIGIRMALGASTRDVLWLLLADGGRLVALGFVIGAPLAFLAARAMGSLLFGVGPLDGPAYAAALAALGVAAFVASILPARRAAGTDPAHALREG